MIDLTVPCWCVAAWLSFGASALAFARDASRVLMRPTYFLIGPPTGAEF